MQGVTKRATLRILSSWTRQQQSATPAVQHCCTAQARTASSSSAPSTTATTTASPPQPTARRPELQHKDLTYLQSLSARDLAAFDPVLDIPPAYKSSPALSPSQRHAAHITHIDPSQPGIYRQKPPSADLLEGMPGEDDSVAHLAQVTDLTPGEIRGLYRFPLVTKRVVSMKSKGKMPSMYALVVVGNGQGLVGVGEGNHDTANKAVQKAFAQAVRSMDYVERYEDRTVWGTMQSNFGSTQIQIRSRPPGFGLRVNHFIHQVAKAAGISDLSAKVYGSRNGTRVIKLAVAMLHGGSTPVDMGGFGHEKGQRRNKKTKGMETADEIGRARGRRAVSASA